MLWKMITECCEKCEYNNVLIHSTSVNDNMDIIINLHDEGMTMPTRYEVTNYYLDTLNTALSGNVGVDIGELMEEVFDIVKVDIADHIGTKEYGWFPDEVGLLEGVLKDIRQLCLTSIIGNNERTVVESIAYNANRSLYKLCMEKLTHTTDLPPYSYYESHKDLLEGVSELCNDIELDLNWYSDGCKDGIAMDSELEKYVATLKLASKELC